VPYIGIATIACIGLLGVDAQQQLAAVRLDGPVYAAAVSPDGRYIAVNTVSFVQNAAGSWDNTESVQALEPATAKLVGKTHLISAELTKEPLTSPGAFVSYCDNGKRLVSYDKNDNLYVLNASSYQVESRISLGLGNLRPHDDQTSGVQLMFSCSANNSLIALAVHGGHFGYGLIKLFDLASGDMLREIYQDSSSGQIGAISMSSSGERLAILLQNPQWPARPLKGPNVDIREANHLKIIARLSTGDAPWNLTFSGETEVVTDQLAVEDKSGKACKRVLRLWNVESGKEEKRLSDSHLDIEGPISSSTDGEAILGYIPSYHECKFCNGLEGRREVKEQRFAVWKKSTGAEVFRSEPIGPVLQPFPPQCVLSQKGTWVVVFWPSRKITPRVFPIP
jgi:WD40 repeat protein